MAKKTVLIGLALLFVVVFASSAHCDTMVKKLGRGIANIGTCYFEIWTQAARVNDSDGPVAALTYGLLKGFIMTGIRGVAGAYEVVTFPIPIPKDYRPIMTDPEFFLEDLSW